MAVDDYITILPLYKNKQQGIETACFRLLLSKEVREHPSTELSRLLPADGDIDIHQAHSQIYSSLRCQELLSLGLLGITDIRIHISRVLADNKQATEPYIIPIELKTIRVPQSTDNKLRDAKIVFNIAGKSFTLPLMTLLQHLSHAYTWLIATPYFTFSDSPREGNEKIPPLHAFTLSGVPIRHTEELTYVVDKVTQAPVAETRKSTTTPAKHRKKTKSKSRKTTPNIAHIHSPENSPAKVIHRTYTFTNEPTEPLTLATIVNTIGKLHTFPAIYPYDSNLQLHKQHLLDGIKPHIPEKNEHEQQHPITHLYTLIDACFDIYSLKQLVDHCLRGTEGYPKISLPFRLHGQGNNPVYYLLKNTQTTLQNVVEADLSNTINETFRLNRQQEENRDAIRQFCDDYAVQIEKRLDHQAQIQLNAVDALINQTQAKLAALTDHIPDTNTLLQQAGQLATDNQAIETSIKQLAEAAQQHEESITTEIQEKTTVLATIQAEIMELQQVPITQLEDKIRINNVRMILVGSAARPVPSAMSNHTEVEVATPELAGRRQQLVREHADSVGDVRQKSGYQESQISSWYNHYLKEKAIIEQQCETARSQLDKIRRLIDAKAILEKTLTDLQHELTQTGTKIAVIENLLSVRTNLAQQLQQPSQAQTSPALRHLAALEKEVETATRKATQLSHGRGQLDKIIEGQDKRIPQKLDELKVTELQLLTAAVNNAEESPTKQNLDTLFVKIFADTDALAQAFSFESHTRQAYPRFQQENVESQSHGYVSFRGMEIALSKTEFGSFITQATQLLDSFKAILKIICQPIPSDKCTLNKDNSINLNSEISKRIQDLATYSHNLSNFAQWLQSQTERLQESRTDELRATIPLYHHLKIEYRKCKVLVDIRVADFLNTVQQDDYKQTIATIGNTGFFGPKPDPAKLTLLTNLYCMLSALQGTYSQKHSAAVHAFLDTFRAAKGLPTKAAHSANGHIMANVHGKGSQSP